jgi:hypothetical protein
MVLTEMVVVSDPSAECDDGTRDDESKAITGAVASTVLNMARNRYPEISCLIPEDGNSAQLEHSQILDLMGNKERKSRGSSLQIMSPEVVPTLWQQQSIEWRVMTRTYLADIAIYVHDFICRLMEHALRTYGHAAGKVH